LIVATPQPETVALSLRPDLVVRLTTAWECEVLTGDEFISRLGARATNYNSPSLSVTRAVFGKLKSGNSALVAKSSRLADGIVFLKHGRASLPAIATTHAVSALKEMSSPEARKVGFSSKKQLRSLLRRQERDILTSAGLVILSPML
jgi:hypothetical protein